MKQYPVQTDLQAELSRLQVECDSLREQVSSLQRAKTIMDLLAGVSHDLAAALTGVVWCSQAICRRLESLDPELSEGVQDFVAAADFARQLARRLVSISRQPETVVSPCLLSDVVRESVSLLEALRPPKARLHVSCQAEHRIVANPDQLQQVLLNLVANAFAAISPDGGNVWIETGESEPPAEKQAAGQRWVLLRVRDDGHGMDQITLQRAFEPFFTTKSVGDANGIGLPVVRTIVEAHSGVVRASSELNAGTSVDVFLPQQVLDTD